MAPDALAFAQEHDASLCAADGTRFSPDDVLPISERHPEDPRALLYSVEPPGPPLALAISGIAIGSVGLIGLATSGVAALPCLGPAGCNLPSWVEPLAWSGLGVAVTGGVLLIVHAALANAPRSNVVQDRGHAEVCTTSADDGPSD